MRPILRPRRLWRPVFLLVVGAAVGASFMAPVAARDTARAAGHSAQATTIHTRTASCAGLDFVPIDSTTTYNHSGMEIYRNSYSGDAYFVCDPGLPNKAVVTKVRFTVQDSDNDGAVRDCALVRTYLTTAYANYYDVLASVPETGIARTPGVVRLVDSSITNATVDNLSFAYFLQCRLVSKYPTVGIFGANVTYTITAANG